MRRATTLGSRRPRQTAAAERSLRRIRRGDQGGYLRLLDALRVLADDPRPPAVVKLGDVDPPAWRIRVGGYRIVYEVRDAELVARDGEGRRHVAQATIGE